MIEPLHELRRRLAAAPVRGVVVREVIDAEAARALREGLEADGLEPFFIADRGRYAVNTRFAGEPVVEQLRALAQEVVEEPLALATVRWTRLQRGDYAMVHGDQLLRPPERHVEVTLDFSEHATGAGPVMFTDGEAAFTMPQLARAAAIVVREPTLGRFEQYLTHRVPPDARIYRARLTLSVPG